MVDNRYRVITRIEKKPERLGKKRVHYDSKHDCGQSCTGHLWGKPCDDGQYDNCDDCVCNHCNDCKCEEEQHVIPST